MRLLKNRDTIIISSVFFFSWIYALVRYNIFDKVDFAHLPLYVTNKSFALSAVILICISTLKNKKFGRDFSIYLNTAGYLFGLTHILISAIIINPGYFPKLFGKGELSVFGELSLLFGVLTFTSFTFLIIFSVTRDYYRNLFKQIFTINFLNLVALTFLSFHALFLGFKNWTDPQTWPGFLPPISLLGFLFSSVTILKRLTIPAQENNDY